VFSERRPLRALAELSSRRWIPALSWQRLSMLLWAVAKADLVRPEEVWGPCGGRGCPQFEHGWTHSVLFFPRHSFPRRYLRSR